MDLTEAQTHQHRWHRQPLLLHRKIKCTNNKDLSNTIGCRCRESKMLFMQQDYFIFQWKHRAQTRIAKPNQTKPNRLLCKMTISFSFRLHHVSLLIASHCFSCMIVMRCLRFVCEWIRFASANTLCNSLRWLAAKCMAFKHTHTYTGAHSISVSVSHSLDRVPGWIVLWLARRSPFKIEIATPHFRHTSQKQTHSNRLYLFLTLLVEQFHRIFQTNNVKCGQMKIGFPFVGCYFNFGCAALNVQGQVMIRMIALLHGNFRFAKLQNMLMPFFGLSFLSPSFVFHVAFSPFRLPFSFAFISTATINSSRSMHRFFSLFKDEFIDWSEAGLNSILGTEITCFRPIHWNS